MNWINKTIINSIIVFISLIIGILIMEFMLRLILSSPVWSKAEEGNILRNVEYAYDVSQIYEGKINTVIYKRDYYGLRSNCDSPSQINVITVGGSTTDQRYIPQHLTFQSVIEQQFKKQFRKEICIANAGIDGHSVFGHNFSFKYWFPLIPDLNPDFVIIYVGINDANFEAMLELENKMIKKKHKNIFSKMYIVKYTKPLVSYFKNLFTKNKTIYAGHKKITFKKSDYSIKELSKDTQVKAAINSKNFEKRFLELLDNISNIGAKPICVTQPHNYITEKNNIKYGIPNIFNNYSGLDYDYSLNEINKIMRKHCKDNLIDIYKHDIDGKYFYDGVHTNQIGSQLIGSIMMNAIEEKQIFDIYK